MKSLSVLLLSSFGLLHSLISNAQELITFDDLKLQGYAGPIPNGYAGLQWDNYGVLSPQEYPIDPVGYLNGMVSPSHVAFNAYANFDESTTGGFHSLGPLFDLNSAYLTAARNDGLQVEALGFVGGILKFSNTYTLNTASPTLVDFNYFGIDRVEFISYGGVPHAILDGGGTPIAMDNMVITVPEPNRFHMLIVAACSAGYWLRKRGCGARRHPSIGGAIKGPE